MAYCKSNAVRQTHRTTQAEAAPGARARATNSFPPRPGQTRLTGTGSSSSERHVRTSTRLRSIPIVRSVCNQLEIYLFAQSNQRCMSNKLIQTTKTNKVTPEKLVSQGTKSTYNCFSIKGKVARGFKQCILYYYYLSVKRILVFSLLGCFFLVPFNGPNWPPTRVMGICGRYRFNSQRMYISSSEHFYFS